MKHLLLAIVSFIIFNQLIHYFVLHSFNLLELKGTFPPSTQIHVDVSNGIYPISSHNQLHSSVHHAKTEQTVKVHLRNRSIHQFRMQFTHDTMYDDNDIQLEKVTLYSYFAKQPVAWAGKHIENSFSVSYNADKTTKTLTLNSPLQASSLFLSYVIPFFLSLCVTLLTRQFNWREFPAIKDLLTNQQARNAGNYLALDGFRGLAALLVLLEHSGPTFKGVGGLGVWMFFVLSGFLLTKPFVLNPQSSINPNMLSNFMARRFKRIIPMYFFMITCIFVLRGHYEVALRHFLFVQGDGHYWTILQEMYFYLLLPFIALAVYLLCRGRSLIAIILLVCIALTWNRLGTTHVFSLYGLNQPLRGHFEIFIIGMIGAYWYHGLYQKSTSLKTYTERFQILLSSLGLVLIIMLIYANIYNNKLGFHITAHKQPLTNAAICILLILLAIIGSPNCWYKRLLANPMLRYIGIIGYSFYLVHPYSVSITHNSIKHFLHVDYTYIGEIWRTGIILLITLIFASFTYSFIERPFLQRNKSE